MLLPLLFGNVLLLIPTVVQLVLQLQAARLQQAAERRAALLRAGLGGSERGVRVISHGLLGLPQCFAVFH